MAAVLTAPERMQMDVRNHALDCGSLFSEQFIFIEELMCGRVARIKTFPREPVRPKVLSLVQST
jgi:hypothetical protein